MPSGNRFIKMKSLRTFEQAKEEVQTSSHMSIMEGKLQSESHLFWTCEGMTHLGWERILQKD